MVDGRKVLGFTKAVRCKTGRGKAAGWLNRCAAGAFIGTCFIPLAFGQGGQTEVSKTVPSNPPPVAAVPAPAPPAPAPAPVPAAKPVSPIGAGAAWQTNTAQPPQQQAAAPAAPTMPQDSDNEVVMKVNAYFNKLSDLQGTFVQTDPDGKHKRGRFYFQRPGKVRFDYTQPNTLRIISDGRSLAIEDHNLNTSEKYPLDVTPFRLLLSETVDLGKDAKIAGVEQGPEITILTVEDKNGEGNGRIRLFFNKADMSLREWIISDAQGLDTRIEVADLDQNKKIGGDIFIISAFAFDRN